MDMIDNFETIKLFMEDTPEFQNNDGDKFFLVEILKRKKENPDIKKDLVLKRYYIKSIDQLIELSSDMKKLCEVFNARAVFHPNLKSERKLAISAIAELSKKFETGVFSNTHRVMDSCAAAQGSCGPKYWILDVDDEPGKSGDMDLIFSVISEVHIINEFLSKIPPCYTYSIKTPHGWHLLVKPFNATEFSKKYPQIQIKKNNSTILYAMG